MSKKAMYYIAIIIVLCIGFSLFYINQYSINNDERSIQSSLKEWLNRASEEELDPNVLETVQLDDTSSYITIFQLENGNHGYSHLIKGINSKFKIQHSGHGTGLVSYQVIDTNKGKYMILYGRNPNLNIDHISLKSIHEDFGFDADVSKNEIFVRYEDVPSDFKNPFPANLTFYDKNNNEILQ